MEKYYKPYNTYLCQFLRSKKYKCPTWAVTFLDVTTNPIFMDPIQDHQKTMVFIFSMERSGSTILSRSLIFFSNGHNFAECFYLKNQIYEGWEGSNIESICPYIQYLRHKCSKKYCICKINAPGMFLNPIQIQKILKCSLRIKTIIHTRKNITAQYLSYSSARDTDNYGVTPTKKALWKFEHPNITIRKPISYQEFEDIKNKWYSRLYKYFPLSYNTTFNDVVYNTYNTSTSIMKYLSN